MRAKLLILPLIALGSLLPVRRLQPRPMDASTPPLRDVSQPPVRKLTPYVRSVLAELSADSGDLKRTVLIAGAPGKNAAIAQQVARVRGSVLYQVDRVGYLRAQVPVSEIEHLADLPEVEALDVVGLQPRPNLEFSSESTWPVPAPQTSAADGRTSKNTRRGGRRHPSPIIPAPDAHTPALNPYLPSGDIGAPQFIRAHPTFDGRGVTVAVVEGVPYLLSPELLRPAVTLQGKPIRKLAGIFVPPGVAAESKSRVRVEGEVTARNGRFPRAGGTYSVAVDGTYRFGLYDANWVEDEMSQGPTTLDRLEAPYGVLWNEATGTVWVDTDQDRDFADETPLRDYNTATEIDTVATVGTFKTKSSGRAGKAGIPFAVGADPTTHSLHLFLGINEHTTGLCSVAVGRGFMQGKVNGVAPGARISLVQAGPRVYGLLEGIICAMTLPDTDVVFYASGMSDEASGQEVFNRIVNRLVEVCHKPIFASAGNVGPGLETLSHPAEPSKVLCVGGYVTRETLRANLGAAASEREYVNNLSSRGPATDGAFKPDLLAPLCTLAAAPAYDPGNYQLHQRAGMYELPPGYHVWSGTSYSSPIAAGGAALLISAARQRGLPYDAERLRRVVKGSARRLKGYAVHEQGSGLIDVPAAWKALQHGPEPVIVEVRAPVRTSMGNDLPIAGEGCGLYEREGWRAGMRADRAIRLKRTSGPQESVRYRLRWVSGNGTFRCASSISLPLGVEVTLPVTVHPATRGIHSAILQLTEPADRSVIAEMPATVIAAEPLLLEPGAGAEIDGSTAWQRASAYYFHVPENAGALDLQVTLSQGRRVSFSLLGPDGQGHPASERQTPGRLSVSVRGPMPGVWEAIVENGTTQGLVDVRQLKAQPAVYALRATVRR